MSWLGPASSGAHPRTKGAVLHRRAPAPITADHEGSPGGSCSLASHRETLREGGRNADQQNARGAARREATFRSRGRGRLGGTRTDQEGVARWASRRACGGVRDRATPPKAARLTGNGAVRSLCGRYGAGARRRAWSCRIRLAACLCSPGSGCTTRTGRSCRCAGAWVRALRACRPLGNLDGQEALPYCAINCEIHAACLPMNTSRVSCPASIMSSACSQTAVVPGSAIAAGTASIKVKAASEARMARPSSRGSRERSGRR